MRERTTNDSVGPNVPIVYAPDRTEPRPARLARADGCATVPLDVESDDVRAPPADSSVGAHRFHWWTATVALRFLRRGDFSIDIAP